MKPMNIILANVRRWSLVRAIRRRKSRHAACKNINKECIIRNDAVAVDKEASDAPACPIQDESGSQPPVEKRKCIM